VKVSADGHGVGSHAGVGLLREVADLTGLSSQVTAALADTYRGPWVHAPGDAFAHLAAAVAEGADCVDGVGQLWGDREHVRYQSGLPGTGRTTMTTPDPESAALGLSRGLGRTGPAASRARRAAHHPAGSFTTRLLWSSVT
jgi:hypothetical protein